MAHLYPTILPKTLAELKNEEGTPHLSDFLARELRTSSKEKIERPNVFYKSAIGGQLIPIRVARVLEVRGTSDDMYRQLQPVPQNICKYPFGVPKIAERVSKYTTIELSKNNYEDKALKLSKAIRDTFPRDLLTEFDDTELAMICFLRNFQHSSESFEKYIQHKYYYLAEIQQHLRMSHGYEEAKNWNLAVDLLQKMLKFELSPFDVRIEGSVKGTCGHGIFYKDEGEKKIYYDAGLRFSCFYREKRVLSISFEYRKENKLFIRQIQGAKGARRELMKVGSYPENILKAFIKQFSGYEVYLIEGQNAMETALGAYAPHFVGDQKDWYYIHQATTKFIQGDVNRIVTFYNQDFPSLEVGPVENGFRKISLKNKPQENII